MGMSTHVTRREAREAALDAVGGDYGATWVEWDPGNPNDPPEWGECWVVRLYETRGHMERDDFAHWVNVDPVTGKAEVQP